MTPKRPGSTSSRSRTTRTSRRFLETWTLLSYVAARTQRVRLAPNVLSVPLRLPAVLARAAASLDLLSGGRVELGLGAGGFRDAIAAIGAPRLTAGQSVEALEESIDIIRAIWDAEEPRGVRYEGRHHRLERQARAGPGAPIGSTSARTSRACWR